MDKLDFLFIKGDDVLNVRLSKYINCLTELGHKVYFWGWNRSCKPNTNLKVSECHYLIQGGGFGGKKVAIRYPLWMLKLFLICLFSGKLKEKQIVAVNFDAALPIFFACFIRRVPYIYEIHDEFALSYNFPNWLKSFIRWIDHTIMQNAKLVIHVDENRVTYKNCNHIIIENAPDDYWKGAERSYDTITNTFAVIGNISDVRGITQIRKFASEHTYVKILLVGKFYNEKLKADLLSLPNVEYYNYMPQNKLFKIMEKCCAIFSLYDPSLEINRLAASNKVYDAMMMGIPVITNKEVINSKFISDQGIGVVVDYKYNETWNILADMNFLKDAVKIGTKGRTLYLEEYQFSKMVATRLIPILSNTDK